MELLIFALVVVVVLGPIGGVLGWVGWRRGTRALAEVSALRESLAAGPTPFVQGAPAPAPSAAPSRVVPPWAVAPPSTPPTSTPPLSTAPLSTAPLGTAPLGTPPLGTPPLGTPLPEPGAAPPTEPELNPAPAKVARKRIDLEQALTQRWGVWLGAAALLLSAVFLVRYAAERGALGPAARCMLAVLLGAALVAGAWWVRRGAEGGGATIRGVRLDADRVPAALAAGGVAMWLAASYGAGPLYELVPSLVAFVLMAAASLAGLALSLLFGPIVGAVGLAAAFATPALVGSDDPSIPGLFLYLAVVSAASWAVVRWMAWSWLGWATVAGGAVWVAVAALGARPGWPDAWAPGLFVPVAAGLALGLLPREAVAHRVGLAFTWASLLAVGLAGLFLMAVTQDPWVRAGVLLLGPVAMAKAWREERLAWLPWVSAALAAAAVAVWPYAGLGYGEVGFTVGDDVYTVQPGGYGTRPWAETLLVPALVAAFYAAAGLAGELRNARPLPWAALVGAMPVSILAVAWWLMGEAAPSPGWAVVAGGLAAALVAWAARVRDGREGQQRAGVHAASAVAALALGAAILLREAWLTAALALLLPGLAWIEGAAGLVALRRVALVVAGTVLVRLVLNPAIADYALGSTPVWNGLLVAYLLPALCFAAASWLFRQRADDRVVAVLEGGACLALGLLAVLEVRHGFNDGWLGFGPAGFAEQAWMVSLVGALGVAWRSVRGRPVVVGAGEIAGGLVLVLGVRLLLDNPLLSNESAGDGRVLSALIPAYAVPACLAMLAIRQGVGRRLGQVLGAYAWVALLLFTLAAVRQAFHPGAIGLETEFDPAELWAISGAWLALGLALMGAGLWSGTRALRLAGIATIGLVAAKVFLVDMGGLDGLWRVLSFLGLGLSLIGLAALTRRFGSGREAEG